MVQGMTIGDSENTSIGRVLKNRSEQSTVDQDDLEALLPRIHDAIMNARTHIPADLPDDGKGSPVDTYLARAVLGVLRADSPSHLGERYRLHKDIETANRALRTAADGLHEQNQTIATLRAERDETAAREAQLRGALTRAKTDLRHIATQADAASPDFSAELDDVVLAATAASGEIDATLATPPSDAARRMQEMEAVVISVEHFLEVATADPGATLGPMAARALAEARQRLDALHALSGKDTPTS